MTTSMRRETTFMLRTWLGVERLLELPFFQGQDANDWEAFLDLSSDVSWNEFAPCYKATDHDEPRLESGRVHVEPGLMSALHVFLEAGLHQATAKPEVGGMGLPFAIASAAMAELMAANVAGSGFVMLSIANTRVITDHGTPAQIAAFAQPQLDGRALGTMCLSEPDVGSSLGDVSTRARRDGADELGIRYLISGRKMWISAGDQNVTDNIFHLVLGKVVGSDGSVIAGAKGTTLFVVPKILPDGRRNDVAVAGLNHKMGYRGTPNCLLNFGEAGGAVGWKIGAEGEGLRIMFQMMNEARVNVGLSGAALAYRGFELSRRYASERIQGRSVLDKTADEPVRLNRHPDVRRMLLAQKAIAEGSLALCLKGAMLADLASHGADESIRKNAHDLLSLLTPVVKTWPSESALTALNQAIQIHGGYGYTRDFDVEQLYRDARLNPIHEGTTGIQAIDLLGRKILFEDGKSFDLLLSEIRRDAHGGDAFEEEAATLSGLCDWFETLVRGELALGRKGVALANASGFLDAFGHFVTGWIWLGMARAAAATNDRVMAEQKAWTCRYYFAAEVPKIKGLVSLLVSSPDLLPTVPEGVVSP